MWCEKNANNALLSTCCEVVTTAESFLFSFLSLFDCIMPIISRDQAVCIFYCQEHNESNVAELTKRIEEMKDIDICYLEDPTEPFLACVTTINSRPFRYHLYPQGITPTDDHLQEEHKVQFGNDG